MGAPIKRGNGGFLNGVAGTVQGYALEQKTGVIGKGDRKGEEYRKFSLKLNVLPDGGKVAEQYLDGGFLYDDNEVSDDKQSIEGKNQFILDGKTELGKFIISLIEGDGNRLPEEALGDLRSFAFLNGIRLKFARVRDEEETKRRGKKKDKKTGKEYDRDQLLCAEVLAVGTGKPAAGAKKAAGKAAPAAKVTAKPAAAAVDTDAADAALTTILKGVADNQIEVTKIGGAVVRYALANKLDAATRDALRKTLADQAYLTDAADRGIVMVDGEGKTQTLTLVEQAEQAAA